MGSLLAEDVRVDYPGDAIAMAPKTSQKLREMAAVLAAVMLALQPDYEFERSKLANSDLSITEIMCRAAALSSALASMRINSTSC